MNKRFVKSLNNKVIGGVCAGIADYLDVDVTLVRILFGVAFFAFGTGFLIYFILWIALPSGMTTQGAFNNNQFSGYNNFETPNNFTTSSETFSEPNADKNQTSNAYKTEFMETKKNKSGLLGGLILITLGILFLLDNLTEIDFSKTWPLMLIVAGVATLFSGVFNKNA